MTIRYKTWTAYEILSAADLISYAENNGAVQITATAELDSLDANVNLAFCTYDWTLYQRTSAGTGSGKFTAIRSVSETLTNKTLTNPTINGATINAASTINGVSGTTISAGYGAWTSWTPTITAGVTTPTASGAYLLIGKTLHFRLAITGGTGTSSTVISITLPDSLSAAAKQQIHCTWEYTVPEQYYSFASSTSLSLYRNGASSWSPAVFSTNNVRASGVIEVS